MAEMSLDAEVAPTRLEAWLQQNVEGYRGPCTLRKFAFGQSNPTFRISATSAEYVLRRKPLGPLLPKAHAIEREFRVLRALSGSGVPVPHVRAFCEDTSLLGTPFYVMDFVEGRIFYDQLLPNLSRVQRAEIFNAMNSAVAKLHLIDPLAVGLEDYGRTDSFISRQVSLWTRQYRACEEYRISAMESLMAWLPQNLPSEQTFRIFHGDLRLDNIIFHPSESRVIAILDWELSTLGDPIADFAYHAMVWRIAPDIFRGFAGVNLAAIGIPEEVDYVRLYCQRTNRTQLPHWTFYLAFSLFRLAAILQGVSRRAQGGNASAGDAAELGSRAALVAAVGWDIARSRDAQADIHREN